MTDITTSAWAVLALAARLTLCAIFVPSAIGKLRDMRGFVGGVLDYRVLPVPLARAFAWALPLIELALVFALLLGVAPALTGVATALLLTAFIAAVGLNLRRGRAVRCSCAGAGADRVISWGLVARNVLLVVLTVPVALLPPTALGPLLWLGEPAATVVLALTVASWLVILQLVEWLVDLAQRQAAFATSLGARKRNT
ncbi:MAG TPA: MauE/DoxX family redox-associated membrane protein [Roseiflexaceae bacterium]|nr:MauE/DoxX family redox-associated membrane protein [Roseiflexaceae bacterium]